MTPEIKAALDSLKAKALEKAEDDEAEMIRTGFVIVDGVIDYLSRIADSLEKIAGQP